MRDLALHHRTVTYSPWVVAAAVGVTIGEEQA